MSTVQVSIIIPVFNAADTLKATLDSVLLQQGITKEIIAVDGGSTDNSLSILSSYSSVLCISGPDQGVYDAMNKGIRMASGQWIYILGADDVLAHAYALHQLIAESDSAQLIFGKIQNSQRSSRYVPEVHQSSFSASLYWRNTLHQQSVIYRRSLFANYSFDSSCKVLGDYKFHLQLYRESVPFCATGHLVATCMAGGLSKNFRSSLYREEWRIKKQLLPLWALLLNAVWIPLKYLIKRFS